MKHNYQEARHCSNCQNSTRCSCKLQPQRINPWYVCDEYKGAAPEPSTLKTKNRIIDEFKMVLKIISMTKTEEGIKDLPSLAKEFLSESEAKK